MSMPPPCPPGPERTPRGEGRRRRRLLVDQDKPNGASAVSVKQSVSPFLDTRIGADMTVADRAR